MTLTPEGGGKGQGRGGGGKLDKIPTPTVKPARLKDLPPDVAEDLLKSEGFPAGSGRIAQAGWSGETPVTKSSIRRLLEDAAGEAESQQGGK